MSRCSTARSRCSCYQAAYHLIAGEVPGPQGRDHLSLPTYRALRCADGIEIVVAANTERMWGDLCAALGCPDLPTDPRFARNEDRLRHRAELVPLLEASAANIDSATLLDALAAAQVPAGPINTLDRALTDVQVRHREMVVEMTTATAASIEVAGNPIKLAGVATDEHAYPPRRGADTLAILEEIGVSKAEIETLAREGIIAAQ